MDTFFALIIIGAADAGLRRGLIKPSLLAPSQSAVVKRNFGNYGGYWLPLVLLLLCRSRDCCWKARVSTRRSPNSPNGRISDAIPPGLKAHSGRYDIPPLAVVGARSARIRAVVLLAVYEIAPFPDCSGQSLFSQSWTARPLDADRGLRKCRNIWRFSNRAIHLEPAGRYANLRRQGDGLSARPDGRSKFIAGT